MVEDVDAMRRMLSDLNPPPEDTWLRAILASEKCWNVSGTFAKSGFVYLAELFSGQKLGPDESNLSFCEKAANSYRKYREFRQTFFPGDVHQREKVTQEADEWQRTGIAQWHGVDNDKRPIVWVRPSKYYADQFDLTSLGLAYAETVEEGIRLADMPYTAKSTDHKIITKQTTKKKDKKPPAHKIPPHHISLPAEGILPVNTTFGHGTIEKEWTRKVVGKPVEFTGESSKSSNSILDGKKKTKSVFLPWSHLPHHRPYYMPGNDDSYEEMGIIITEEVISEEKSRKKTGDIKREDVPKPSEEKLFVPGSEDDLVKASSKKGASKWNNMISKHIDEQETPGSVDPERLKMIVSTEDAKRQQFGQFSVVFDRRELSFWHSRKNAGECRRLVSKHAHDTFTLMNAYYARVGDVYLLNANIITWLIVTLVGPFMEPEMMRKAKLLGETRELLEYMDIDQIPEPWHSEIKNGK